MLMMGIVPVDALYVRTNEEVRKLPALAAALYTTESDSGIQKKWEQSLYSREAITIE